MKTLTICTQVVAVVAMGMAGPTLAQGFSKLLQKVELLEKRLDELQTREIGMRLDDLTARQNQDAQDTAGQLAALQQETSGYSPGIVGLETRIAQLADQVLLVQERAAERETSADVDLLTDELRNLVEELRTVLSANDTGELFGANSGPSLMGFFDISGANLSARDNPWALGPFELDLEYHYGDNFGGAGAFVFEDGVADVGVAFIDYHQFDQKKAPARGRIFNEPGFHIQIGRFDVPFGLDYLRFAAPDRETITPPMITEYVMDGGWNDDGIRVYGSHKSLDFSAFTVNGFKDGFAYGGRLGISPFRDPYKLHKAGIGKLLRLGISYARDEARTGAHQEVLFGYDLQSAFSQFEFQGEYLRRRDPVDHIQRSGFYLTGKFTSGSSPVAWVVEYGEFKKQGFTEVRRITLSATRAFNEYALLRGEYLRHLDADLSAFEDEAHKDGYMGKLILSF